MGHRPREVTKKCHDRVRNERQRRRRERQAKTVQVQQIQVAYRYGLRQWTSIPGKECIQGTDMMFDIWHAVTWQTGWMDLHSGLKTHIRLPSQATRIKQIRSDSERKPIACEACCCGR